MCLAVPAEIIEMDGDIATIEIGGVRRQANTSFVDDPVVGDYVLVHAGFAIKKWSKCDVDEYNLIMNDISKAMGESGQ